MDPESRNAPELLALVRRVVEYLVETENADTRAGRSRPARQGAVDIGDSLRRLLTVRPPGPLPTHVHEWLDAVLHGERDAAGIVDAMSLAPVSAETPNTWFAPAECVALWQGDITRLAADAIVNAANSQLLGCFRPFHACIDNAIHWAAGPRLREECGRMMATQQSEEPTGLAKLTRGYNLPARFVLHTVGPVVRGPLTAQHKLDLASCYRSCLNMAADAGDIRTIAFCAVSTGVFGFPKPEAAAIALRAVAEWLRDHPGVFSKVIFNVFSDDDRETYASALAGRTSHAAI
jgi:O-acetyl-ADP-ribose deacetylase (regulator of RNase III)